MLYSINWKDELNHAFAWKRSIPQNDKNRIDYIDLAKGLCILLVVFHHVALIDHDLDYPLKNTLKMFRMPLYFLLSGLFFKQYEGFFGFLKRKINKLLIPYIAFFIITWISPFTNSAIWFLLCLFIVNIFFYLTFEVASVVENRINGKAGETIKVAIITFICIVLGCVGFYLCRHNIIIKPFVTTAFVALPFFGIGFIMRKYTDILNNSKFDKFVFLAAIPLFVIAWLCSGYVNYRLGVFNVNIISLYIGGFAGIMAILFVAKTLRRLPILSYCGRYSIIILVTHIFLLKVCEKKAINLMMGCGLSEIFAVIVLSLIVMLAYTFIIPVIKTYMPHITAQKDIIPINKNQ